MMPRLLKLRDRHSIHPGPNRFAGRRPGAFLRTPAACHSLSAAGVRRAGATRRPDAQPELPGPAQRQTFKFAAKRSAMRYMVRRDSDEKAGTAASFKFLSSS